jgi:hypothetical protein
MMDWNYSYVSTVRDLDSFLNPVLQQLGSVAGPVIQANGMLTFEDDLRSSTQ